VTANAKRQHYVPRFLLTRFSSRRVGEKAWVWQYARDADPVEISVKDAAVSKYFYGRASPVDRGFTDLEPGFAACLKALDEGPRLCDGEMEILTLLVWTLAVRTRAIRMELLELYDLLMEELEGMLAGPEGADLLLDFWRRNLPTLVADDLRNAPLWQRWIAKGLLKTERGRGWLVSLLEHELRSQRLGPNLVPFFRAARDREIVLKAAADGQHRGLHHLVESEEVPSHFSPDGWTLSRHQGLILGDTCVVSINGDNVAASVTKHHDDWTTCYLPMDPGTLLVGHATPARHSLATSEVNGASAALSHSHFWASSYQAELHELAQVIGTGTPLFSAEERRTLILESFRGSPTG
jgi:hypothetical protein